MSSEKIFTEEELEEMGAMTVDLLERAIDLEDKDKAKKLARRMYREGLSIHDLYRDWVTGLLTFIGKRYGDEVLHEAFVEAWGDCIKPMLDMHEKADIRRRVQLVAGALRSHYQAVEIREDEEKFVFKMKPCGSGGRLVLEGKYGPPRNFLEVKKPQPMTYGIEDLPVYCCHGHFMASLPLAWGRAPVMFEIPSDKPGKKPCEFWVYKDPQAIPPEAYAKSGVEIEKGKTSY